MEYLSDGPLAKLWEYAVFKDTLTPETVSRLDVHNAIEALKTAPALPLPVAGALLHALSRVLDSSAEFALEEARETNRELYTTFKEQININDGGEIDGRASDAAPPMETGLELGNLTLPDSLLGRRHQVAPQDVSIDAIVREDRSADESENNVLEEVPQRSAEELEALEALDLGESGDAGVDADAGDMFEFPTIPESDEGLEFGSDMQNSSSPPHTPRADAEIDVRVGGSSSPQAPLEDVPKRRSARRLGAPVDDIISIVRPTKPSAQILRRPNTIAVREDPAHSLETESDELIPLDEATERLVDPAYIQAEMKRRRLDGDLSVGSDAAQVLSALDVDLPSMNDAADLDAADVDAGWDMDMDMDMGGGLDDDEPSRIESDSASQSDSDPEDMQDTAEALEEGAAAARAVLHSHLKKKGSVVMFDDIATSAKTRADTLLEVLALAAKGRVAPHQDGPWEPIAIKQL